MSFYRQFSIFLIIILMCSMSCSTQADEINNHNILLNKKIQMILDKNRTKYNLPAISMSIKFPDHNTPENFVSGYYSSSQNKGITPETLFQIGSITKTFTATIIIKLIEQHKLHLNDKLSRWFPQYPRWKNITVYDLLHHTSGIYDYSSGQFFDKLLRKNSHKEWSLSQLANIAYEHTDLFSPGKKYNYTNTDYILLGMIIEKVMHQSMSQVFDVYLKQYNLMNTFYLTSTYRPEIQNRISHGYNRDGTFPFNTDVTFVSLPFGSAGNMISTSEDLTKWLGDLFAGRIITMESLAAMTAVISETDARPINIQKLNLSNKLLRSKSFIEIGAGAGIGLVYLKNNGFTWVHAGGTPGYESFYAYNPCNGIYMALAYNVKPKQRLIFINIANEVFREINSSGKPLLKICHISLL